MRGDLDELEAGSFEQLDHPVHHARLLIAHRVGVERRGRPGSRAVDAGTIEVTVPDQYDEDRVGLLARLQQLEVEPAQRARVIIDERTGTVVITADVRIAPVAVAQGGLTVTIDEAPIVSQPGPLAGGDTTVVPDSDVTATAEGGALRVLQPGASLQDVVSALNALGARPRDLIVIFEHLHAIGALHAELVVQ